MDNTSAKFESFYQDLFHSAGNGSGGTRLSLREWLDVAESWRIKQTLSECNGNRSAAARVLGIGRRTLYSKMERLGIATRSRAWSGNSGATPLGSQAMASGEPGQPSIAVCSASSDE